MSDVELILQIDMNAVSVGTCEMISSFIMLS